MTARLFWNQQICAVTESPRAERKRLLSAALRDGTSSKEGILKHFVNPNHPPAPLQWLRISFLIAPLSPPWPEVKIVGLVKP
jgi:hypothetical protein